jgi:type I restriction enzyme R subunit
VYQEVTSNERKNIGLLEANRAIFDMLVGKTKITVSENELSGEQSPQVRLLDFEHWQNNSFIAINQFKILTTGGLEKALFQILYFL